MYSTKRYFFKRNLEPDIGADGSVIFFALFALVAVARILSSMLLTWEVKIPVYGRSEQPAPPEDRKLPSLCRQCALRCYNGRKNHQTCNLIQRSIPPPSTDYAWKNGRSNVESGGSFPMTKNMVAGSASEERDFGRLIIGEGDSLLSMLSDLALLEID